MELNEALNYLFLLSFSLTGRSASARKLLQSSLAYSGKFKQILEQKAPILLDHHELQDLENFMLEYFLRDQDADSSKRKQAVSSSDFFKISAKSRFFLAKFHFDSQELMISLKDEFIEPILEFGTQLKLASFKSIDREETKCVITRSALIRLLQTKEALSFREHTSECPSCLAFEKQFRQDMQVLLKQVARPEVGLSEVDIDDLIFSFRHPDNDYAFLAMHKLKQLGQKVFRF